MKRTLLCIALCGSALWAEDVSKEKDPFELSLTTSAALYPDADHQSGSSHFSKPNGSFDGADLAFQFDAAYTLPFLKGSDALTEDNHLTFNMGVEVTPVSLSPVASIVFSPIAFLEFAIGGKAGSGWNVGDLFYGIAEYNPFKQDYEALDPFSSWYLNAWMSGTFQFDLAAIWEGDFHHVIASATYKAGYQTLTGTDETFWIWQTKNAMVEGWIYEQEYILGYQMPFLLSMIAVGTTLSGHYQESDYGKFASSYDGDFMTIDIWPLAEVTLNAKNRIYILADFSSRRSFREKYKDQEHEPLMTACGREWYFDGIAMQWIHLF